MLFEDREETLCLQKNPCRELRKDPAGVGTWTFFLRGDSDDHTPLEASSGNDDMFLSVLRIPPPATHHKNPSASLRWILGCRPTKAVHTSEASHAFTLKEQLFWPFTVHTLQTTESLNLLEILKAQMGTNTVPLTV